MVQVADTLKLDDPHPLRSLDWSTFLCVVLR